MNKNVNIERMELLGVFGEDTDKNIVYLSEVAFYDDLKKEIEFEMERRKLPLHLKLAARASIAALAAKIKILEMVQ